MYLRDWQRALQEPYFIAIYSSLVLRRMEAYFWEKSKQLLELYLFVITGCSLFSVIFTALLSSADER